MLEPSAKRLSIKFVLLPRYDGGAYCTTIASSLIRAAFPVVAEISRFASSSAHRPAALRSSALALRSPRLLAGTMIAQPPFWTNLPYS